MDKAIRELAVEVLKFPNCSFREFVTNLKLRDREDTDDKSMYMYDLDVTRAIFFGYSTDNRIIYDLPATDYLKYDETNNRYLFYIGGVCIGYVDATGFCNGAPP